DGLEGNRRAQRVTKWFLTHEWAIVGTGDVPQIETSFTAAYLFGSGDGTELVDRIEDRIDALPGLAGLGLVRKGIDEARAHVIAEEGAVTVPRQISLADPQLTAASRADRPAAAVGQNA